MMRAGAIMKTLPSVLALGTLIVVLASAAALGGLLWGGGEPASFTTVQGDTVELYGAGLYRHDTVFVGAGFRGTDVVTLTLGIPLLVAGLLLYRRGSLRGGLLLTGAFAYILYVYASLSLSAQFNPLFLLYVALWWASAYALVLLLGAVDLKSLSPGALRRLPCRGPSAFMFVAGTATALVWLTPAISALIGGEVPARSEGYATAVTVALDLAIIVPACLTCGALLLRRAPLGYVLAFPLLGVIAMLGPGFAARTWMQVAAGVHFTTVEMAGPIGGFGVVAVLAVWAMAAILQRLPGQATRPTVVVGPDGATDADAAAQAA